MSKGHNFLSLVNVRSGHKYTAVNCLVCFLFLILRLKTNVFSHILYMFRHKSTLQKTY